jgi:hypothetical protein
MAEVAALRQAGDLPNAARLYRQETGVTWDEAHAAIRDWTNNAPERKVRAILRSLKGPVLTEADADLRRG